MPSACLFCDLNVFRRRVLNDISVVRRRLDHGRRAFWKYQRNKTDGETSRSRRQLAGHPVHDDDNDDLLRVNGEAAKSTRSLWGMPRENVPRPTTRFLLAITKTPPFSCPLIAGKGTAQKRIGNTARVIKTRSVRENEFRKRNDKRNPGGRRLGRCASPPTGNVCTFVTRASLNTCWSECIQT